MKLEVRVIVSRDDGKSAQVSVNALQIDTNVDGVDPGVQKQDFLEQATNLMRSVTENQIPALYAKVIDEPRQPEPAGEGTGTEDRKKKA